MWPECINNLTPAAIALQDVPGDSLVLAFEGCGWPELTGESPVRPVALLGTCSTAAYPECPNFPDWHHENAEEEGADYLEEIGLYSWFDFDLVGATHSTLKLRAVYNCGDADCNDGRWGAVWDRDTGALVANISSVGDCETRVDVVSVEHEKKFRPSAEWQGAGGAPHGITFGTNSVIERLIGVALFWHLHLGNEEYD
jgi:hypothetical protein